MKIRITKEFRFEMAHALYGHDGPCRHIHGHSYRLSVTVLGKIADAPGPKNGMVFDFADLKKIVSEQIISPYDHALVLCEQMPEALWLRQQEDHKLILVSYQPTCEQLCARFAGLISSALPPHIELQRLALYETATSCAEWCREDNPSTSL